MTQRWTEIGDVLSEDLASHYPKVGARIERLIGNAKFDSVQFWRDSKTGKDVPFILFSEAQLHALLTLRMVAKAQLQTPSSTWSLANKSDKQTDSKVADRPTSPKSVEPNGVKSGLQQTLEQRLVSLIPNFESATVGRLARTRSQNKQAAKWTLTVHFSDKTKPVVLKSAVQARLLIKTDRKIVILREDADEIWLGFEPQFEGLLVALKASTLWGPGVEKAINAAIQKLAAEMPVES